MQNRSDAQRDEDNSQNEAGTQIDFCQSADKMQTEKKDECAGNRSEERAVLAQEGADGAGRSSKRDEDKRETRDERQGGSKKASTGRLPLAQLFHADAG
jgi:hypothetical protein